MRILTLLFRFGLVSLIPAAGTVRAGQGAPLGFEERVRAQEAIERIYHRHRVDANRAFEDVIPRTVLEEKVHAYISASLWLEQAWHTEITTEALQRELQRIATNTQFPERLVEIYTALDHDGELILECFARPSLVNRLARSFFVNDERVQPKRSWKDWVLARSAEVNEGIPFPSTDSQAGWTPPMPTLESAAAETCLAADSWAPGVLANVPEGMIINSAVWTGTELIIWGGIRDVRVNTGNRYDPLTDTWQSMTLFDAPSERHAHAAVWTGERMLVWGGSGSTGPLGDGASYDPATDTWESMTMSGAPTPRSFSDAIWTGTEMIVWGGSITAGNVTDTGGRYNPSTDSWSPTSLVDAPSARGSHSTVWTGTEMIVWGGGAPVAGQFYLGTGGRYNPATDTWIRTNQSTNPPGRVGHHAVWTGTEMIVWGGDNFTGLLDDGSRYDPSLDAWTPMTNVDVPPALRFYSALWTGSRMFVWGSLTSFPNFGTLTGGLYDPATDTWAPVSEVNRPRMYGPAVWTGSLVLMWGGNRATNEGGRYDPISDTWTPMATTLLRGRVGHEATWNGTHMFVWGGFQKRYGPTVTEYFGDGGLYDPTTDTWAPTSMAGAPSLRWAHSVVWTGEEFIVWGGSQDNVELNDGALYDPANDLWSTISGAQAPAARDGHHAFWTGSRMLIWGSTGDGTGGLYDPGNNRWSATSLDGAPLGASARAVWTGSEMLAWAGSPVVGASYNPTNDTWSDIDSPPSALSGSYVWTGTEALFWDSGARYRANNNMWSELTSVGAPTGEGTAAVWTGTEMIVWGRSASLIREGARYDPVADTWSPTSLIGAPSRRTGHTAVWIGNLMLVFGGQDSQFDTYMNTGGGYAPVEVAGADLDEDGVLSCLDCDDSNAFTGPGFPEICDGLDNNCDGLIPLEEADSDSDGALVCAGDCDDDDPGVGPAASEICNARDDDCDGLVDEDASGEDSDSDGVHNACDNCPQDSNAGQGDLDLDGEGDQCDLDDGRIVFTLIEPGQQRWQDEGGGARFNLYRGDLTVLTQTFEYTQDPATGNAERFCGIQGSVANDGYLPDLGNAAFYLVAEVHGNQEGSLDQDSSGVERPNDHPCP